MRTALLFGKEDIRLRSDPLPPNPGPEEVLMRIAFCGVCGTDLHKWSGKITSTRHGPIELPKNFGHEYSGVVEKVGAAVTRCAVGDRVTVNPYKFCGRCFYCRNGIARFCSQRVDYTAGWAEFATVDESVVYKLPDNVSLEVGALAEPLAACLHAVEIGEIKSGSVVVVLGGGPIGLMVAALARASGAATTILSEPSPSRRAVAKQMGVSIAIDPRQDDLMATVRGATAGIGADIVFDCVTFSSTMAQGLDCLRLGGTLVVVGNTPPEDRISLSPLEIHRRGLVIKGSFSRGYEFERAVRWLSVIDFTPLLTHKLDLADTNEAMRMMRDGIGVKILLETGAK